MILLRNLSAANSSCQVAVAPRAAALVTAQRGLTGLVRPATLLSNKVRSLEVTKLLVIRCCYILSRELADFVSTRTGPRNAGDGLGHGVWLKASNMSLPGFRPDFWRWR